MTTTQPDNKPAAQPQTVLFRRPGQQAVAPERLPSVNMPVGKITNVMFDGLFSPCKLRIAIVALAVVFSLFVWPTPYRYFTANILTSDGRPQLIRQNRITGSCAFLHFRTGWVKIDKD